MKILLLGANGQVGWQLRRCLSTIGSVTALTADSQDLCGNLLDPEALVRTVQALQPHIVVNAAAYTAVDAAEDDPDTAFAVNSKACLALAQATHDLGAWLVHFSTDYVYDGSGEQPWQESDPAAPINTYGRSKLAGDQAIAQHNPRHLIFRTSWVYDSWGRNFAKTMLTLAQSRKQLNVVCDQWGAPTRAALLADVTACALHQIRHAAQPSALAGTYHVAASGETNWHAYAQHVVAEGLARGLPLTLTADDVKAVSTSAYPTRAPRPHNSRLDTSLLRKTFTLELPDWREGVSAVVAEIAHHRAQPHAK